jgi:uncharacterized protein (DUF983 family)
MATLQIDKQYKIDSEFKAALHAKCPRCRTGNMFANSMYGFTGQKMNDNCPHCNLKFEREPGYFYVAMFVSYALNVAQMVTLALGTYILTGSNSPWLYITILLGVAFLLSPFNFRYSRVVLLYWLTPGLHFNPEKAKAHPAI